MREKQPTSTPQEPLRLSEDEAEAIELLRSMTKEQREAFLRTVRATKGSSSEGS